ncbi:hypothetical protein ASPBRDRAFT_435914 [Aspergillus brasiliensis CBS 101740]|uniref:Uncharacterized protein n=1 Tax=Aspergillus brasiliensis (strain CBS 101740 / IMI 381727 / IBT 21946) TaxID=767769 RepID=A0A1L9U2M0_ASPBC|nr:hypothetical protein ASPBRDRAFT_435914 [Aspergillus brasiliensis CBS 101740]
MSQNAASSTHHKDLQAANGAGFTCLIRFISDNGSLLPVAILHSHRDSISRVASLLKTDSDDTSGLIAEVDCGSAAFPKERWLGLNSNPTSIYLDVRGPHPARPAAAPSNLMQL